MRTPSGDLHNTPPSRALGVSGFIGIFSPRRCGFGDLSGTGSGGRALDPVRRPKDGPTTLLPSVGWSGVPCRPFPGRCPSRPCEWARGKRGNLGPPGPSGASGKGGTLTLVLPSILVSPVYPRNSFERGEDRGRWVGGCVPMRLCVCTLVTGRGAEGGGVCSYT